MGLMMSGLMLARWLFGGGVALMLASVPLLAGIGPYTVVTGIVLIAAGLVLAPRSGSRDWERSTVTATDRRRRQSNALLLIGAAAAFIGLASALSSVGLIILALAPLPITAAAVLLPSRWRLIAALVVWGCWCVGLYLVLA
ncbi:MAG: hypothetical protein OXD50_16460 [Chloroflexi bacterium]|nr:hypothetical protein [Chloroflexota bacterium]